MDIVALLIIRRGRCFSERDRVGFCFILSESSVGIHIPKQGGFFKPVPPLR